MEEQDKPKSIFPPAYAYLEDSLRVTQGKLQEIDQRIENLPQDRGHRLNFRPPGDYKVNDRGKQLSRREQLEYEKEEIKTAYAQNVDHKLIWADPATAKRVKEMVVYQLSDNGYKNRPLEKLAADRAEVKNLDKSFDYMSAQYFAKYGSLGRPLQEHESIKHAPKYNIDQMGKRFLKQLSFPEKVETPDQSLGQQKDKRDPDMDK